MAQYIKKIEYVRFQQTLRNQKIANKYHLQTLKGN